MPAGLLGSPLPPGETACPVSPLSHAWEPLGLRAKGERSVRAGCQSVQGKRDVLADERRRQRLVPDEEPII